MNYVGLDLRCNRILYQGGEYVRADWNYLPFREGSFDVVLWCEAIEHTTNPYHVLHEIVEVSKMDATLILSTPWMQPEDTLYPATDHFFSFNEERLEKILSPFYDTVHLEVLKRPEGVAGYDWIIYQGTRG